MELFNDPLDVFELDKWVDVSLLNIRLDLCLDAQLGLLEVLVLLAFLGNLLGQV